MVKFIQFGIKLYNLVLYHHHTKFDERNWCAHAQMHVDI